mmetsp:Transcript_41174/g.66230  ORF Transcript_41174/g.66230 Transcript_41174/m.66230 type:complete len:94 (-) Transcript_41174:61-342(-)
MRDLATCSMIGGLYADVACFIDVASAASGPLEWSWQCLCMCIRGRRCGADNDDDVAATGEHVVMTHSSKAAIDATWRKALTAGNPLAPKGSSR